MSTAERAKKRPDIPADTISDEKVVRILGYELTGRGEIRGRIIVKHLWANRYRINVHNWQTGAPDHSYFVVLKGFGDDRKCVVRNDRKKLK